MGASDGVKRLADRFAGDAYRDSLNETQVRQQYIDPFFEELGWDEIEHKFRELASLVLPADSVDAIVGKVKRLEEVDDVGELTKLLATRSRGKT